jgi:hypothetical protein
MVNSLCILPEFSKSKDYDPNKNLIRIRLNPCAEMDTYPYQAIKKRRKKFSFKVSDKIINWVIFCISYVLYSTLLHLCRPSDSTLSVDAGIGTIKLIYLFLINFLHSMSKQNHILQSAQDLYHKKNIGGFRQKKLCSIELF